MCQRENEIPDDVIKKDVTGNIIVVLILLFVFYVGFMAGSFRIQLRDNYMSEYLDAYKPSPEMERRDAIKISTANRNIMKSEGFIK